MHENLESFRTLKVNNSKPHKIYSICYNVSHIDQNNVDSCGTIALTTTYILKRIYE